MVLLDPFGEAGYIFTCAFGKLFVALLKNRVMEEIRILLEKIRKNTAQEWWHSNASNIKT